MTKAKKVIQLYIHSIAQCIHGGNQTKFVGIRKHPNRDDQRVLVYEYKGYIWAVPFVFEADGIFLKTIYPSRKLKKIYQKRRSNEENKINETRTLD